MLPNVSLSLFIYVFIFITTISFRRKNTEKHHHHHITQKSPFIRFYRKANNIFTVRNLR